VALVHTNDAGGKLPEMRYLAQQRLVQASVLLRETSDSMARIAYEVGYESEASLNRAFKREYGVPPAAWRREGAERGAGLPTPNQSL